MAKKILPLLLAAILVGVAVWVKRSKQAETPGKTETASAETESGVQKTDAPAEAAGPTYLYFGGA